MVYEYDPALALHEAQRMWITGDGHIRSLEDVSAINPGWENSVLTMLALIRFHEDSANLVGIVPQNSVEESDE